MPRKSPSRLELRKQNEAAEAAGIDAVEKPAKKKKKKAAKKRTTRRTKEETLEKKRLVWVIYTATLREEARFAYDQRTEAEERLEQLLAKGKRTYFLQPVKELLSGGPATPKVETEPEEEPVVVEDVEQDASETDDDDAEVDEELEVDTDSDDD